jgi:hypothetical protein
MNVNVFILIVSSTGQLHVPFSKFEYTHFILRIVVSFNRSESNCGNITRLIISEFNYTAIITDLQERQVTIQRSPQINSDQNEFAHCDPYYKRYICYNDDPSNRKIET